MSNATSYHLLGESSTSPDIDDDNDDNDEVDSPLLITSTKMGKRLGTFRVFYLVALCCIGSFLFAYVGKPMMNVW